MAEQFCNHRWEAPRVEVPSSVDVLHVCTGAMYHERVHRCSCGATTPVDDD